MLKKLSGKADSHPIVTDPPVLRWRAGARRGPILSGGSVKAGKDVVLTAERGYLETGPPQTFTIHRSFGAVIRKFRQSRGKSPTVVLDRLAAHSDGSEPYWTDLWRLRTPDHRLKWRLSFEDNYQNWSSTIAVSRIGTVSPNIGPTLPVPGAPGVGVTIAIEVETIVSVDPVLDVAVLTPWGTGDNDLRAYLEDVAADAADEGEDVGTVAADLREYLGEYLPIDPPRGWEIRLSNDRLELDEGQSALVRVELDAPTPGATALAVQMIVEGVEGDTTDPEPSGWRTIASDPILVRVPPDPADVPTIEGLDTENDTV